MSPIYSLEIETELTVDEVKKIALKEAKLKKIDDTYFKAPGIVVFVDSASKFRKEIVKKDFDFTPTLCIYIRLDIDDYKKRKGNAVKIVSSIVESIDGNSVLTFQNEEVCLLRKDKQLFLRSSDPMGLNTLFKKTLSIPFKLF